MNQKDSKPLLVGSTSGWLGAVVVCASIALAGCGGDDGTSISPATVLRSSSALASTSTPATGTTLYASPTGSGDCSSAGSACRLEQAQSKVRSLLSSGTTDVQVQLGDGTYRLSSTWSFGAADSGSPGHPVVWTAAPGAHPVISGATQISNWSAAGGGVWSAPVAAGSNSRQLYVNGAQAPVAQQTPDQLGFGGWTGSATGYSIKSDSVAMAWFGKLSPTQIAGIEFVYAQGNGNWTESRCRVAGYSNGNLTMAQPCWTNVTKRATFSQGSGILPSMNPGTIPSSIQNALALIQPGQWFLDTAAHQLHYQPIPGQQLANLDVELPQLETLLQGAGSLAKPLHDLSFSGLQFSYATWNDPSTSAGFADVQSNLRMTSASGNQGMCNFASPAGSCPWGALTQPLANVSFTASNHITLSGNRFINLGGAGLAFKYGSSNNLIQNNEFASIASTGIMMGCTYDPTPTDATTAAAIKQNCNPNPGVVASDVIGTNEIMSDNRIIGNLIHNIGTDYHSACGITLLFSRKTTIAQNEIHDVPYSAITAGVIQGHVDDASHPQNSVNINDSNTISNNLLHDYMAGLVDGGAIYIEGHQAQYQYPSGGTTLDPVATLAHGMQVIGNVAYNGNSTNFTFYDDAGSEWISWTGNAAFNAGTYSQGGCSSTGHIWASGNYVGGAMESYQCQPPAIDTHASGNTKISSMTDIPSSILANAGRKGIQDAISESEVNGRIGDAASQISYTGSWQRQTGRAGYDYLHDLHYTTGDHDTMSIPFNGTAIQIFGEQYVDQGNLGISIDGGTQQVVSTIPADGKRHSNVAVYTSPVLARGKHTLTVTKLSGSYATMNGAYITP
ncbi:hypothetical protein ACVBGC_18765 [Burkholderia stagnalis]